MTPLGCPDCLLIRYEPRALRARLRASMNARARSRTPFPRSRFPTELVSLDFFSFPFCGRGSFFGLFACARFRCFVRSFFAEDTRCRRCLSIHTAERGNRENSWVSRDARQTAAMKSLMLLRFPSNITCFSPVPLYSVLPRNKAPYAAAAVSSLTSACLLWRVLNLYRIAEYRALLSTVISPGLVIVAILQRSIALS